MPKATAWTDATDHKIKLMRSEGATWDAIAAEFGVARYTAAARGEKIGAKLPPPDFIPAEDADRGSLPAGHSLTWGAMIAGSCIDGETYPVPVSP